MGIGVVPSVINLVNYFEELVSIVHNLGACVEISMRYFKSLKQPVVMDVHDILWRIFG